MNEGSTKVERKIRGSIEASMRGQRAGPGMFSEYKIPRMLIFNGI
jgi:hypothetical protein